jgi:hypothetical protein
MPNDYRRVSGIVSKKRQHSLCPKSAAQNLIENPDGTSYRYGSNIQMAQRNHPVKTTALIKLTPMMKMASLSQCVDTIPHGNVLPEKGRALADAALPRWY